MSDPVKALANAIRNRPSGGMYADDLSRMLVAALEADGWVLGRLEWACRDSEGGPVDFLTFGKIQVARVATLTADTTGLFTAQYGNVVEWFNDREKACASVHAAVRKAMRNE